MDYAPVGVGSNASGASIVEWSSILVRLEILGRGYGAYWALWTQDISDPVMWVQRVQTFRSWDRIVSGHFEPGSKMSQDTLDLGLMCSMLLQAVCNFVGLFRPHYVLKTDIRIVI